MYLVCFKTLKCNKVDTLSLQTAPLCPMGIEFRMEKAFPPVLSKSTFHFVADTECSLTDYNSAWYDKLALMANAAYRSTSCLSIICVTRPNHYHTSLRVSLAG